MHTDPQHALLLRSPAKTFHLTYVTNTYKLVSELTLDFLWLRLSEESLNVMEGLWDLPDVFGEMSWWGLLPSQLQLLSLWRTPRGILRGERWVGKDRLCNSCAGELEKSNNEKMSDPLKVSTDNKDGKLYLCWHECTDSILLHSWWFSDGVYICMHIYMPF